MNVSIVFTLGMWRLKIPSFTDLKKNINTASRQDTANDHTNQMGDFFAPMRFGRVLPPTIAHIVWGSVDPPMEG